MYLSQRKYTIERMPEAFGGNSSLRLLFFEITDEQPQNELDFFILAQVFRYSKLK